MANPLQQLDNARVIVEMNLPGRHLVLEGRGKYELRAQGNRLNVRIDDPEAPFTIVLEENSWAGEVVQEPDGSYRVKLAAP